MDEGGVVDPYFFEAVDSIGGEGVTDHGIRFEVGLVVFVEGLVLHEIDVFCYYFEMPQIVFLPVTSHFFQQIIRNLPLLVHYA